MLIIDTVIAVLSSLKKGSFVVVTDTSHSPLKKGPRATMTSETSIPDRFRDGVRTIKYKKYTLGADYVDLVNRQRLKEEEEVGDSELNFGKKVKKSYCHAVHENGILQKHNDKEDYYVRIYPQLCKSEFEEERVIYLDSNGDVLSTEEYFDADKKYMKEWKNPESKKASQVHQGVSDVVIVNNVKLENVKLLEVENSDVTGPDGKIIIGELDSELLSKLLK